MADYNPPTEIDPIFNSANFTSADSYITQGQADKRYLRYPNAQGTENLKAIVVSGSATLQSTMSVAGTSTFADAITMNGALSTNKSINNCYYNMINTSNGIKQGYIALSGTAMNYHNDGSNSGTHYFYAKDSGGTIQQVALFSVDHSTIYYPLIASSTLSVSSTTGMGGALTMNGATAANRTINTSILSLSDYTSGVANKSQQYYNTTTWTFNNLVNNGSVSFNCLDNTGTSFETLNLNTTTSTMSKPLSLNGAAASDRLFYVGNIRMTDVGTGTQSMAQNYFSGTGWSFENLQNSGTINLKTKTSGGVLTSILTLSTSTATIASPASFTSTTPPISSGTQPAYTDSSTIIPTTAWVQSALTGYRTASVYSQSYTSTQGVNAPTGCVAMDIFIVGAGGACGAVNGSYYGGSGSGGNAGWCSGIPMTGDITLQVNIVAGSGTGYSQVTYGGINMCKVYNGNAGSNATAGAGGAGGTVNATASTFDTSFGTWTSASGTAGVAGTTSPPSIGFNQSCYKGCLVWAATNNGCGQQVTGTALQPGIVVITWHLK